MQFDFMFCRSIYIIIPYNVPFILSIVESYFCTRSFLFNKHIIHNKINNSLQYEYLIVIFLMG